MRIEELNNGLLVAPLQITYNGLTITVENVAIDTGAVRSIIHVDAVESLDINPSPTDHITRMYGIGGEEFSFRKHIERVVFAGVSLHDISLDFGKIESINGLIGLDILRASSFVIDLEALEIYQKR